MPFNVLCSIRKRLKCTMSHLAEKSESKAESFILLLGGTRSSPGQVFAILENSALEMPSVTKAVDYALKVTYMYIFDLHYQPQWFADWQS